MPLLPALVFFAVQAPQTIPLAGRMVPVVPTPPVETPSQELSNWSGWGPFVGKVGVAASVPMIGEAVLKTPIAADAVAWHVKAVLFPSVDLVENAENGTVRSYRLSFADPQVNETLAALARLPGVVAAATGGKVRVIVDATVEPEPARDRVGPAGTAFGPAWREEYFSPRINGGRYQAEDRLFRGPYPSVILLAPGRTDPSLSEVNGSPVATAVAGAGMTDASLYGAWVKTAEARSVALGYGGRLGGDVPWGDLASGDPPSTEDVNRAKASEGTRAEPFAVPFSFEESYLAPGGKVELATDAERGPILRLSETGTVRTGGIALPLPKEGLSTEAGGILTFWFRSNSKDPLAVMAFGEGGKTASYSIGRDRAPAVNGGLPELDVPADGMWHKVGVDLKAAGLTKVTRLVLGPSAAARQTSPAALTSPTWDLDDFALEASGATALLPAPAADANSADAESRLLAVPSADAATLVRLLNDPDTNVRLSAATILETKADASHALALLAAANSLDPLVARSAVRAYARLDQPDEREQLLILLK
ncbi:hypothetical protein EON79_15805, partial [bacterium]